MHVPNHFDERRWVNRDLVREPDRHRVRSLWTLILGIAIACAPLGAYLIQQNRCLALDYEVDAGRDRLEGLQERERALSVRRAELESFEGIERWALDEHGMRRPETSQIVVVRRAVPAEGNLLARRSDAGDTTTEPRER